MPPKRRDDDDSEDEDAPVAKRHATDGSVLDMVIAAIRALKSHCGSSTKAILNYCADEYQMDDADDIKDCIKAAVASGKLTKVKASYKVTGDPAYPDMTDKVEIEEKAAGEGGQPVSKGHTVTISYKGTLAEDGHEFDAGTNFSFTVGEGEVIKGMDSGVLGMRVGGRRVLRIPASLGYGKRGSKPDIPPNAALVFDITLEDIAD